jgi:hypothetical protein
MGNYNPQGGASPLLQGSSPTLQASNTSGLQVQPAAQQTLQQTVAPAYNQTLSQPAGVRNTAGVSSAVSPAVDPNAAANAAAAAKAAADAAQASALRDQITGLVNTVKDIFNSRYGQVDASSADQVGKLNARFGNESSDLTRQITDQNNTAGAAFAGRGTRDSSDYGNSVDTITHAGESQIRDLGTELQDNVGKVGAWASGQKASFDASKGGLDVVLSHLAETTDPNQLATIRNQIDSQIATLHGQAADNNTTPQNIAALDSIAPTNARVQQLKTTLSQIVGGSADPGQKAAIGHALISNAGLTPDEQQKLATAFTVDLQTPQKDPNAATPTA